MEIVTSKISDTQILIQKIDEYGTKSSIYDVTFIREQIINITSQREEMMRLKEQELAECNFILDEMSKLEIGVK